MSFSLRLRQSTNIYWVPPFTLFCVESDRECHNQPQRSDDCRPSTQRRQDQGEGRIQKIWRKRDANQYILFLCPFVYISSPHHQGRKLKLDPLRHGCHFTAGTEWGHRNQSNQHFLQTRLQDTVYKVLPKFSKALMK